jgi:hypothetical protein
MNLPGFRVTERSKTPNLRHHERAGGDRVGREEVEEHGPLVRSNCSRSQRGTRRSSHRSRESE